MASPFPLSASKPGEGHVVVSLLPTKISALSKITYQYPLKLISPSPTSTQYSILVFLLTYGGGLVGGDTVHLKIDVQPSTKLSIVTQGHTKVFKSPSRDVITKQDLEVNISENGSLCLLPDPIQPFGESVYSQHQTFNLTPTSSLILLDSISAGRTARGEFWDLRSFSGRNEIRVDGKLVLRDNVILSSEAGADGKMTLKEQMQGVEVFGTLVLVGPKMEGLARFFEEEFKKMPRLGMKDFRSQAAKDAAKDVLVSEEESWRNRRLEREKVDGLLWSAAKVRGCTVVKFGCRSVEGGRTWLGDMILRDGSVVSNFGEDAVMCVK